MKRILQSFFALSLMLLATTGAFAQLPDGSIGPDFTKTDINGDEHNMYEWLDNGYSVILDFSATWCGPCWSYHTSGTLEEVWENHGPAGWDGVSDDTTDDIMIFFMEGDDDTNQADLEGTGSNTAGDWITGTYYPIIDDVYDVFLDYECTYYPTMYTICQNRVCTETGQISADAHYDFASSNDCQTPPPANDASLSAYTGDVVTCGEVNASVDMLNLGNNALTSVEITVNNCIGCPVVVDWNGNLGSFSSENVDLGTFDVNAPMTLDFEITTADDNASNNGLSAAIGGATEATTWWFIDFNFDCWSEETSWDVTDENGAVVANGSYEAGLTDASESFGLPSTGCYSFNLHDAYGDGMFGSQWTSCEINGSCSVYTELGGIFSYDGSYDFETEGAGANVTVTTVDETVANAANMNVYPNPFSDVTNLEFTVANSAAVTMDVINMLGAIVMTNDFGTLSNGTHRTELDFTSVDAGLYFVNLSVDGVTTTTKITLTK